ncbi:MAG: hypothetical protein WCH05_05610 [Chlorobiaceae bacterium]
MAQEVPVTIHSPETADQPREPQHESNIPDQIKEIGAALSDAFARFKESESYDRLLQGADTAKEFIKKYPTQAMLYALGTGAFFGLLMRRKR